MAVYHVRSDDMSIAEDIDSFCQQVEGREVNKESTLGEYEKWVRRFELWRPGGEVTEGDIRSFDSYLADETMADYEWENRRGRPAPDSYSYSSRVKMASALKLWCKFEYGEEVTTEAQNIVKGEPEPFQPTILDASEVRRTIRNGDVMCDRPGCKAAMQLSYDAILRGSELVRVRREDIDWSAGTIFVRATKGSNQVTVSLDDRTLDALKVHADAWPERDKLFHHSYGRPQSAQVWNNHVRRGHHDAGSHALFRHSPVCHRLNSGQSLGDVYRRARHTHLQTTMRYAKLVDADVDTAGLPGDFEE